MSVVAEVEVVVAMVQFVVAVMAVVLAQVNVRCMTLFDAKRQIDEKGSF